MSLILEKLRQYWPLLLTCVASLLVGAGISWRLKPDVVRVEEKVRIQEVEKQVVVVQEKVRVEVVKVKDTQVVERWHREKTEDIKPDGTIVRREVEDKNIDTIVHDQTNSTEIRVVEIEKQVVVEREKIVEKTIDPVLTNWRVGALVGIQPSLVPLSVQPMTFGLEVERRLAGPFFVGGWAITNIDVVRPQFQDVKLGLKLGIEF